MYNTIEWMFVSPQKFYVEIIIPSITIFEGGDFGKLLGHKEGALMNGISALIKGSPDTCTPVFIAALSIIARTWKQPRCPSADEWTRKPWYINTTEYYSTIKKNTFESVLMRWMKLEPIIQSEVSQKEKHQYSILTHIYGI